MRRRDREVTDSNEIIHILDTGKVLHLGLVDQGKPYIVPMNYGYILEGDKLVFYLHGALEGRKLDIVRNNSIVAFRLSATYNHFQVKLPANMDAATILLMDLERQRLWKCRRKKSRH